MQFWLSILTKAASPGGFRLNSLPRLVISNGLPESVAALWTRSSIIQLALVYLPWNGMPRNGSSICFLIGVEDGDQFLSCFLF